MRFGLFYEHSTTRPWDDYTEYRVYHQALEQCIVADEAGFDQVWEVEHHFLEEYSHSSAPEIFLTMVAARTKQIHVCHGVCMILPPFNHPARCAERAATLDIVSNGRLEFGTGRSATWTELGGFRAEPDETKEMWDEALRAVPQMWMNDVFSWDGKYFKMPPRNVLPKPIQKPHPPLWVAVSSPETAIQAAERGIGLLGVSLGTPEEQEQRVKDYRRIIKSCEPVGAFVNDQVNGVGWMYCSEDNEEGRRYGMQGAFAFRRAAAHLMGVGAVYPSPAYGAQASAVVLRERPGDVVGAQGGGQPMGDPMTVVEALRRWDEIGMDRMNFLIHFDQVIPQHKILNSLRLFGREVMPALPDRTPRQPLTTVPALEAARMDPSWVYAGPNGAAAAAAS
jgi:alkanesulfonate monooxygenase SsuD/methylene tetrahydromethanopterin reductase-like flavin-dependent oxidoreductase (luciferase family)